MNEIKLICNSGKNKGKEYIISKTDTNIGRSKNNDIVVDDNESSREHAMIIKKNNQLSIIDKNSSNGTLVNGNRVVQQNLINSDIVQIGRTLFSIECPMDDTSATDRMGSFTMIRPIEEFNPKMLDISTYEKEITGMVREEISRIYDESGSGKDSSLVNKNLNLIYTVSNLHRKVHKLDELQDKICDIIFRIMGVERAVLFLKENDNFIPKAVRTDSDSPVQAKDIKISNTILEQTVLNKAGVITGDAARDRRFDGSKSIIAQQINSAMCVPLIINGNIEGAIYVDNSRCLDVFSETDLKTLVSIACASAVAIENFILIDKVKSETLTREKFQRYLSPDVAEQIVQGNKNVELGGTRKNVTVLFADIRNFTELSEKTPPAETVNIINDLFSILTDKVFEFGGMLDKFIGDALMAIFGAPIEYEDHAYRAVESSIAMQKEVLRFNSKRTSLGKNALNIGIGIDTGECIIGNMGSPKRMNYTAIGSTVNTASRIVSICPGGDIYINNTTFTVIENMIETKKIKPISVKGKTDKLTIYSIVWQN
ncbi:adenylate/guanylate cyclase domain-containing protein [Elusimicrobiota bacterium]